MLTVIGLGNILRGDDGIGPVIIEQLEGEISPLKTKLLDAGSDAFMVLEKLLEPGPVVVIDCAYMGEEPGQVRRIRVKDAGLLLEQFGLSMHGFSLADILKMAQSIGVEPDMTIVGVEPKEIKFNTGISKEVEKSIPTIMRMVMEEAKSYAEKNIDH